MRDACFMVLSLRSFPFSLLAYLIKRRDFKASGDRALNAVSDNTL